MSAVLPQPDLTDVDLVTVLSALADRVRLTYVRLLAADPTERRCGHVLDGTGINISKSTLSYHLTTLRNAGLTTTRVEGSGRFIALRRAELDERFPGLIDAIMQPLALAGDQRVAATSPAGTYSA